MQKTGAVSIAGYAYIINAFNYKTFSQISVI